MRSVDIFVTRNRYISCGNSIYPPFGGLDMISLLLAPQEISSALALIERRRPISKLLRSYIEGAKRHIMCRKAHIVEKLQADGLEFFW